MNIIKQAMRRPALESVISDEIYQAKRDHLQARAAAEHYKAVANMLADRIARLNAAYAAEVGGKQQ